MSTLYGKVNRIKVMAQFIHPAGLIVKMIFWRLAPGPWLPAFSEFKTGRFGHLPACDELSRVGVSNQSF